MATVNEYSTYYDNLGLIRLNKEVMYERFTCLQTRIHSSKSSLVKTSCSWWKIPQYRLFQQPEILCAAENAQQVIQAPGAAGGRGEEHHFGDQHVPVLPLLALVAGIDRDVFGLYTCQGNVIQVQKYRHHQQRKPLSAACGVNPHSIDEAMSYF